MLCAALRCLRVCCLFVSAASIRKIITLDMIEYTAEYESTYLHNDIHTNMHKRYQSRALLDIGPLTSPVPSKSPRDSFRMLLLLAALWLRLNIVFALSQWAIPVSLLVCTKLTWRINVSGYNVV